MYISVLILAVTLITPCISSPIVQAVYDRVFNRNKGESTPNEADTNEDADGKQYPLKSTFYSWKLI